MILFYVFCPSFIPKIPKNSFVTSPILSVLTDRGESHCTLTILPCIWSLCPHSIQWEWGNLGSPTSSSRVWLILIHPFLTRAWSISVSSLLKWGFYLALISTRLGLSFYLLRNYYHYLVWWIVRFWCLGSEKASRARPGEYASSSLFQSRSSLVVGNLNGNTTWCVRLVKEASDP